MRGVRPPCSHRCAARCLLPLQVALVAGGPCMVENRRYIILKVIWIGDKECFERGGPHPHMPQLKRLPSKEYFGSPPGLVVLSLRTETSLVRCCLPAYTARHWASDA